MEIREIIEIIIWTITVAVPAGVAIYYKIKNGRLNEAVDDFIEVVEVQNDKKLKRRVETKMREKTHNNVLLPRLLDKGYIGANGDGNSGHGETTE